MTAKRDRSESPASARKRDVSTLPPGWDSCEHLDGSSSPDASTLAASPASTSSLSSCNTPNGSFEASSLIDESSPTYTNSNAVSPTANSTELTLFTRSAKLPTTVVDTDARGAGFATPSTNGERTHEGTIVSPYVANNFRYSPSVSLTGYAPAESFPMFRSGNVLIKTTVEPARHWQLHSQILVRHSPWFARTMQDAVQDERPTWFFFTIEDVDGTPALVRHDVRGNLPAIEDTPGDIFSKILIKSEDPEDSTVPANEIPTSTPRSDDSAVVPTQRKDFTSLVEIYNQVLGAFYNVPPPTPPADVSEALAHAEKLIEVANNLGCLHLLTAHIGNTLLQYRQAVFTAIKDDPARWLLLAISLQNDNLYTEALIHLVGAHPCWPWPTKRQSLPDEIRRLIAQKSKVLDQLCLETERDLLLLTIDVRGRPVVPEVKAQLDTWFVVATFRHIVATEITSLENSKRGPLKRGTMFRKIAKAGGEYLDTEAMRHLMDKVMPSALDNVGEDLKMLKEFAKQYVGELARNELMLDVGAHDVGYLTCVKVGPEDIPWRAVGLGGV